jgi:hypothetical protein
MQVLLLGPALDGSKAVLVEELAGISHSSSASFVTATHVLATRGGVALTVGSLSLLGRSLVPTSAHEYTLNGIRVCLVATGAASEVARVIVTDDQTSVTLAPVEYAGTPPPGQDRRILPIHAIVAGSVQERCAIQRLVHHELCVRNGAAAAAAAAAAAGPSAPIQAITIRHSQVRPTHVTWTHYASNAPDFDYDLPDLVGAPYAAFILDAATCDCRHVEALPRAFWQRFFVWPQEGDDGVPPPHLILTFVNDDDDDEEEEKEEGALLSRAQTAIEHVFARCLDRHVSPGHTPLRFGQPWLARTHIDVLRRRQAEVYASSKATLCARLLSPLPPAPVLAPVPSHLLRADEIYALLPTNKDAYAAWESEVGALPRGALDLLLEKLTAASTSASDLARATRLVIWRDKHSRTGADWRTFCELVRAHLATLRHVVILGDDPYTYRAARSQVQAPSAAPKFPDPCAIYVVHSGGKEYQDAATETRTTNAALSYGLSRAQFSLTLCHTPPEYLQHMDAPLEALPETLRFSSPHVALACMEAAVTHELGSPQPDVFICGATPALQHGAALFADTLEKRAVAARARHVAEKAAAQVTRQHELQEQAKRAQSAAFAASQKRKRSEAAASASSPPPAQKPFVHHQQ